MVSVVCICQQICPMGPLAMMHWPSPYRAPTSLLDMGPHCTGIKQVWPCPQICSNLFNLHLTVQEPPPQVMFKLPHDKASCTVDKGVVRILLECFLVALDYRKMHLGNYSNFIISHNVAIL